MSLKEWVVNLPDGVHIVVRNDFKLGKIVDFAVVLVYQDECISRYDTADKAAHRDVLGKKQGLIKKEWHGSLPRKKVFENAIQDYKTQPN